MLIPLASGIIMLGWATLITSCTMLLDEDKGVAASAIMLAVGGLIGTAENLSNPGMSTDQSFGFFVFCIAIAGSILATQVISSRTAPLRIIRTHY